VSRVKSKKHEHLIEVEPRVLPLQAWATRYRVPMSDARELQRLLRRRLHQGTQECNGDPHPRVKDPTDKNACSLAWGEDHSNTIGQINAVVTKHGLQMDYGVGLWGAIKKNGEYIDNIPG
jgi:hypothetical protein